MYKAEVRDEQIGLKKHQNPESEGFIWICKMSRERERERERERLEMQSTPLIENKEP